MAQKNIAAQKIEGLCCKNDVLGDGLSYWDIDGAIERWMELLEELCY